MENGMNNDFQNLNVNSTSENTVNNVSNTNETIVNDVFQNGTMNSNIPNSDMGGNSKKSKKNNKLFFISGIIVLIIILGLGGLFLYKTHVNNPLKLYKSALDRIYKEASSALDEMEEAAKDFSLEDTVVMDGALKLNSNIPGLEDYTKYDYDFKVGVDFKNEKMELGAAMSEGSKEIISLFAYILNNNIYLKSDQAYNKVLYMESEEDIFGEFDMSEMEEMSISYDEMDILMKKFTEYLGNAFDEDKFEKEDGTVTLDGKKIKVTKVIYPISKNTLPDLINSVTKDMANDEEFIDILVKFAKFEGEDISAEDIKDGLKTIEVSKEDFEDMAKIDFCLYTKGFFSKVVGFGFEGFGGDFSYVYEGEKSEFLVDIEGVEFTVITNDNISNGKLEVLNQKILTFKMVTEENDKSKKNDLEFDLDVEGIKMSGKLGSYVKEISDKKAESSLTVEFKMIAEGETADLGAKLDFVTEIGGKVAEDNSSEAVNIETLTDTELQTIITNVENAVKDTFLYELLFSADDSYYDYNFSS